ncbi:biotin--[acetyl-CoA-carboxylase] ligase [Alkaliphilus peptidifermentans]|uniref:Bifunctional ligase/repressor BirA n=1 Tax=Alkaliphilus peptidifermentans DSM 18978 TaxID=1120976 RepID=A0A1G5KGH6_9FIRM|nr:biotin--[acetyl-CoA-carboxylase] ligase [Alkaliphilus peptidifermentans]SCY99676.1 BirA family transcriptional regulator, biotin operon repressor / biotin-[acetyl-CoA-carboxylase] ligase [Alkaliphilus peptidifermentans DSM 18978]
MKNKILQELISQQGAYISGESLAEKCNVSRTAIWKQINALKKDGYIIETANRRGYLLKENDDMLLPAEIQANLNTSEIGKKIIHFQSIDSTNTYAKEIAEKMPSGTIIVSEEQLGGKGRMGKDWTSPKGEGIWMSVILKPHIPPEEGSKLTQIAAAAVCEGIRSITGLNALIKWPNDVVVGGRKVCGILTEMVAEINQIHYLIVGPGINVNNSRFDESLSNIATSLYLEKGEKIHRKKLLCEIINKFDQLYNDFITEGTLKKSIDICRMNSALIGREIIIHQGGKKIKAKALDITEDGLLEVIYEDGSKSKIISGEVSIRGKNGYV